MFHDLPPASASNSVVRLRRVNKLAWLAVFALFIGVGAFLFQQRSVLAMQSMRLTGSLPQDRNPVKAPELAGGDWLNTAGPLKLEDLRGKVVLLDFWTFCCINCIHILPDLEKLEKKYPNELVVIGVHSAKFQAEKETKNIREAILRYHIEHPVVNDADHKIWNSYGVRSWPTFWLIDPEGNVVGQTSGEGKLEILDSVIGKLIEKHREKKTLDPKPIRISLEKDKMMAGPAAPLHYPGKVLADLGGNRLFIADSSHHRIVITDLLGKKIDIVGKGISGNTDGKFEDALFNDPQGMALKGNLLYVADRKNHQIREVNLSERTVTKIAGTGIQGRDREGGGPAHLVGLNSPWDLLLIGETLYIAMAGHHQIWTLDLQRKTTRVFAGNGYEDIVDGSLPNSSFAQPSGLSTDGAYIYVADSEVSAIRAVPLDSSKEVKSIVGSGLFTFGDKDGTGDAVRLQHALGVAVWQNNLVVTDTYNNKLKLIDPKTRQTMTFLGDGKPGKEDQPARFNEPAGIHIAGDTAYIADTNNHLIRIVDLKKKTAKTLALSSVEAPSPARAKPSFRNLINVALNETAIPTTGDLQLQIKVNPPPGSKVDETSPISYLVEAVDGEKKVTYETFGELFGSTSLKVPASKFQKSKKLKVSVEYYPCSIGQGLCQVKSQSWEIPLKPDAKASAVLLLETRQ